MKIGKLSSLLLVAVVLGSCVTYRLQPVVPSGSKLTAAPSQSVSKVTQDGLTFAVSADWAPEIRFDVEVTNGTDRTVVVESDRFRLYTGDPDRWTEVSMVTSDDYYRREERWSTNRTVAVTSTGTTTTRRTTATTIGTPGSGGSVTIIRTEQVPETRTSTVVYTDPGAAQRLAQLKTRLFYSATLTAGSSHRGLVFGASSRGQYYKLVIPVDGKDYEVFFERVKEKTSPFTNVDF